MAKMNVTFIRKDGSELAIYDKLKHSPEIGDNVRFKTADGFDFFLVVARQFDYQHAHLTVICDSVEDQEKRRGVPINDDPDASQLCYQAMPRNTAAKRLEALLKTLDMIATWSGLSRHMREQLVRLIKHVRADGESDTAMADWFRERQVPYSSYAKVLEKNEHLVNFLNELKTRAELKPGAELIEQINRALDWKKPD